MYYVTRTQHSCLHIYTEHDPSCFVLCCTRRQSAKLTDFLGCAEEEHLPTRCVLSTLTQWLEPSPQFCDARSTVLTLPIKKQLMELRTCPEFQSLSVGTGTRTRPDSHAFMVLI